MIKKALRAVIVLCGMLLGYGLSALFIELLEKKFVFETWEIIAITAVSCLLFAIIFHKLFKGISDRRENITGTLTRAINSIPTNELVAGSLGLLFGLMLAFLISQIINGIEVLQTAYISNIISVLLYLGLGFAGVTVGQTVAKSITLRLPAQVATSQPQKSSKKQRSNARPKVLDTSVIIDGRILDILKTGFIEGDIIIPEFVLVELRHIADSADALKRNRGRRGLDILNKIQQEHGIEIYNTESDKTLAEIPEVDVKLLKLAQMMKGAVVTNDYNLNKVASIQGVKVLNINELANTLKPVVLPGETMQVFLVKEGKEQGQGVAFLDDGTMIVVEDGKKWIGSTIDINVTSVLQTSAGRMIFGKHE